MSQPTQSPAPESFALDSHTKQFFDPAEWEGAAEARFFLDMPGMVGRVFIGRIARLGSFEPVIALTEIGGDGQTLLKRPPYGLWRCDAHRSKRPHHWEQWLGLAIYPRPSGCPLPILPDLSANRGLARLHYDGASGFGAQVSTGGDGYLFDLRDPESAERRQRPRVDLANFVDAPGMESLGQMGANEFHDAVDALFRDEGRPVFQVLRFYTLSNDGRSLEVFGCDYRALRRTLHGLRLALQLALGPGGEFAGCSRASWYPWHGIPSEAISVHLGELSWRETAPPPRLSSLAERVFAATGCRLRLERKITDSREMEKETRDARVVGLEWANEFRVRSEGVNAHEAMEAAMDLKEMLG